MDRRRKVRRGRWLLRASVALVLTCAAVLGSAVWVGTGDPRMPVRTVVPAQPFDPVPRRVAPATHLESPYVAPGGPIPAALGRLRLARLGIDAPVVPVGWDGDTMAVPNDPGTLGWFQPSARLDDLAGASLIAGHVSDASDRLGPLGRLIRARRGDVLEWRERARISRFRITAIRQFPRLRGLPASLFRVDGPHTLVLVTCTRRVVGPSGIHYADNLVVTAVPA